MEENQEQNPTSTSKSSSKRGGKRGKGKKLTKLQAAIIIQKVYRGWLQRHLFKLTRQRALRRTTCFKSYITKYRHHILEIRKRHGNEDPYVEVNFSELDEYMEKVSKFEVTFRSVLPENQEGLKFKELRGYFTKLHLHPSEKEISDAAHCMHPDSETKWTHEFTMKEVVEISLHIYVPKGTNMVVRKSTWLNPLIDEQEAMALAHLKTGTTNVEKAFTLVVNAQKNLGGDEESEQNESSHPPPASSTKKGGKAKKSAKKRT